VLEDGWGHLNIIIREIIMHN